MPLVCFTLALDCKSVVDGGGWQPVPSLLIQLVGWFFSLLWVADRVFFTGLFSASRCFYVVGSFLFHYSVTLLLICLKQSPCLVGFSPNPRGGRGSPDSFGGSKYQVARLSSTLLG